MKQGVAKSLTRSGSASKLAKISCDVLNNERTNMESITVGYKAIGQVNGVISHLHWRRMASIGSIFILCYFGFMGNVMSGDKFSEQGSALTKLMYEELINKGICADRQSCFNLVQMYREDGDRIYLNMYAQTNMSLSSVVAQFMVEKGIKITDGKPITLRIFSKPKTEHLGLKSIFGPRGESIKLEINK
jgi:hypothetical protein